MGNRVITDIDKLVTDLKLGVNVEVTWNDGEEYIHVDYVKN